MGVYFEGSRIVGVFFPAQHVTALNRSDQACSLKGLYPAIKIGKVILDPIRRRLSTDEGELGKVEARKRRGNHILTMLGHHPPRVPSSVHQASVSCWTPYWPRN